MHIKDNLPETVVAIIQVVKRYRSEAQTNVNFDHHAALEDLQTHLSDFLSAMIASPLTGRVFLSHPRAYISEADQEASLQQNFIHA